MNIYKIHVETESDNKQAQELLFQLGYGWTDELEKKVSTSQDAINEGYSSDYQIAFLYAESDGRLYHDTNDQDGYEGYVKKSAKELTISTLQDLVVLHSNSPEDANYALIVASDRPDNDIFKSSEGVFYSFAENNQTWVECNSINDKTTGLKKLLPKGQPSGASTEFKTIQVEGLEGLVDGKAALTAALAGETVQITFEPWEEKSWENFNPLEDELSTKIFFTGMSTDVRKVFFRIKPKTILINGVEVPAPFFHCPEVDQVYLYLDDSEPEGFTGEKFCGSYEPAFVYGWWDSKEKIKQVVAALRKVFEVQP
ncbi:hypothetical protein AXY30_RS03905 [Acinetobacter baumannii]|nr:hypothetical protein [Acinetobacter baumannii]